MDLKLNAERFTGKKYISLYDKYRPTPPVDIMHQTINYLNQRSKADMIVDLGCGTGISTNSWSSFSNKIIGIDPSKEMIDIAKLKINKKKNIDYFVEYSNNIPLSSKSADIISCSQSFHWMEPNSTLNEVDRVLKNHGVFVIFDVIWPPSVNCEFENIYNELFLNVSELTSEIKEITAHRWNKGNHFANIKKCDFFKFVKETYYHKTEKLSKEQFIGIALSQGGLETLLKRGFSEEEIGITKFKNKINALRSIPFKEITYNYRVIYAVKQ